jgi:hypothetical protein
LLQGRNNPSSFGTMCSGDDQLDLERQTVHIFSSAMNSASAIQSMPRSKRQNLADKGRPFVSSVCSTLWSGLGVVVPIPTTPLKSGQELANRRRNNRQLRNERLADSTSLATDWQERHGVKYTVGGGINQ